MRCAKRFKRCQYCNADVLYYITVWSGTNKLHDHSFKRSNNNFFSAIGDYISDSEMNSLLQAIKANVDNEDYEFKVCIGKTYSPNSIEVIKLTNEQKHFRQISQQRALKRCPECGCELVKRFLSKAKKCKACKWSSEMTKFKWCSSRLRNSVSFLSQMQIMRQGAIKSNLQKPNVGASVLCDLRPMGKPMKTENETYS